MKLLVALIALCALPGMSALAQDLPFPDSDIGDAKTLDAAIAQVARASLAAQPPLEPQQRFQHQVAASEFAAAAATFATWRTQPPAPGTFHPSIRLELYSKAKALEASERVAFRDAFARVYAQMFGRFDDRAALDAGWFLETPPSVFEGAWTRTLARHKGRSTISRTDAAELIGAYVEREAARAMLPLVPTAIDADGASRYVVDENAMIRTKDGATLSAIVVRKKGTASTQPASLWFNIYVNRAASLFEAKRATLHGYVGVAADPRGKRLSPDRIDPWVTEAQDAYAIVDWIGKQSWSNGQVGMYGHSHGGFAAWAAAKSGHPALKTIVTMSASQPGLGLPMENNVFLFANYAWPFYVMNNKLTDDAVFFDFQRWNKLQGTWYASGKPFRDIDSIDGTPNPLLQRQLQHPSFDTYYQSMQPYGKDYARIDFPVLSITGYFDEANPSAMNYVREHYAHNARANHYVVVGPYEHTSTFRSFKPRVVRGYTIDPAAQFDTAALTYAWFDHVIRGSAKPSLLRDRINYQVMGANVWRHAPSLASLSNESRAFYLSTHKDGERYRLTNERPSMPVTLQHAIDFADRTTQNNLYPIQAIRPQVAADNGFAFVSDPFTEVLSFDGQLSGELRATINKRDMDFTLALYELMPDGRYFTLSYYLGRASYAQDMTKRTLLTPGQPATIPFHRTRFVSRQMSIGSRLLFLLTVNKNEHAQVNYGTGKDVSDESIADAREPLRVQWHTDSRISVPLKRVVGASQATP